MSRSETSNLSFLASYWLFFLSHRSYLNKHSHPYKCVCVIAVNNDLWLLLSLLHHFNGIDQTGWHIRQMTPCRMLVQCVHLFNAITRQSQSVVHTAKHMSVLPKWIFLRTNTRKRWKKWQHNRTLLPTTSGRTCVREMNLAGDVPDEYRALISRKIRKIRKIDISGWQNTTIWLSPWNNKGTDQENSFARPSLPKTGGQFAYSETCFTLRQTNVSYTLIYWHNSTQIWTVGVLGCTRCVE